MVATATAGGSLAAFSAFTFYFLISFRFSNALMILELRLLCAVFRGVWQSDHGSIPRAGCSPDR